MNRGKCGSCDMYSKEYKCTKKEIKVTMQHIIDVKVSNKNPQSTFKTSELIQVDNFI